MSAVLVVTARLARLLRAAKGSLEWRVERQPLCQGQVVCSGHPSRFRHAAKCCMMSGRRDRQTHGNYAGGYCCLRIFNVREKPKPSIWVSQQL
jgi:hypothetical protein